MKSKLNRYILTITFSIFMILPCFSQVEQNNVVNFTKGDQTLGNTRTFGMAVADIDLDNDLDILMANYIGPSQLWINRGDGTFDLSDQTFNVTEAHDVGLADFNGDTFPDIIILSHAGPSKIFFNNQMSGFVESEQTIGSAADYPQYVYINDIENDGDEDFLIYNWQETPNRLWKNDGSGTFTMVDKDFGGPEAKGFLLTDLSGDFYPDLYINMGEASNQIWFNDKMGNFDVDAYYFGSGGNSSQFGDINKDGAIDLFISDNNGLTFWENLSNRGFFNARILTNEALTDCKLFDADSDGDQDIITIHQENGNKLWLNDGEGSFTSLGTIFGTSEVFSTVCADFDGDNDIDVVLGQMEESGGNAIYFNNSKTSGISELKGNENILTINNVFPNPGEEEVFLIYEVKTPGKISGKIYDLKGRLVRSLTKLDNQPGTHSYCIDISEMEAGTYNIFLMSENNSSYCHQTFIKT